MNQNLRNIGHYFELAAAWAEYWICEARDWLLSLFQRNK